jgi:hypothetical protein
MARADRIHNDVLLEAGLELMRLNGKPLAKLPSKGRSRLYKLPSGETVRARTCNDHIFIAVADKPSADARLNIEGTDWLFVVMPEIERTEGKIIAYLIPAEEAVAEVRQAHQSWLASNPNTKGANTAWSIWFDHGGYVGSNNYAEKWAKYRLEGDVSTLDFSSKQAPPAGEAADIKGEVEAARQRIARAAGVAPESVKISIDFGI